MLRHYKGALAVDALLKWGAAVLRPYACTTEL
jgi:hypothetical protein